jgi:hypothetical protein
MIAFHDELIEIQGASTAVLPLARYCVLFKVVYRPCAQGIVATRLLSEGLVGCGWEAAAAPNGTQ